MNYLACWLTCFMDEEKAFWTLCRVIEDIRPRDFYSRDISPMHGFKCECRVLGALVRTRLPGFLDHLRLEEEELDTLVTMFGSKTLIPIFVNLMQPSTLMVVWDMFLSGREEFGRSTTAPEKSQAEILGLALDLEEDVPRKELGGEASLLRVCLAVFQTTLQIHYPGEWRMDGRGMDAWDGWMILFASVPLPRRSISSFLALSCRGDGEEWTPTEVCRRHHRGGREILCRGGCVGCVHTAPGCVSEHDSDATHGSPSLRVCEHQ